MPRISLRARNWRSEGRDRDHRAATYRQKFVARFGLEAMQWVNSPLGKQLHLRGVNARVVQPGVIRVGDRVRKL